jgi:hypothetical protein
MANRRELDYRGLWIPVVCFLIAASAANRHTPYCRWVQHALGAERVSDSPKDYVVERVAIGVSALSALLLILLLAAFTWRRAWYWTFTGVFPAFMLLGQPIGYAIALLWACLMRIDPTQADSLMRDNALEDRAAAITLLYLPAVIAGGLLVASLLWRLWAIRSSSTGGGATADFRG